MEEHTEKKEEWYSNVSFGLGIASVFLWEFSIIPLAAIILGIVGLAKSKKEDGQQWKAITGIALGALFCMVRIYNL